MRNQHDQTSLILLTAEVEAREFGWIGIAQRAKQYIKKCYTINYKTVLNFLKNFLFQFFQNYG